MERDFWLSRWKNQQIGFHEGVPNIFLTEHFSKLSVPPGGRIFVPLCGKSQDIIWLCNHGFSVAGIELSRLAIEQFFSESGLVPEITAAGPLERFEAGRITLFAGDLFDLTADILQHVDAVYDRAALVALPGSMRQDYVRHVITLTAGAPEFLITLDYDQSAVTGPPFAVPEAELRSYYGVSFNLDCIGSRDIPGGMKGRCPAREYAWLLSRFR